MNKTKLEVIRINEDVIATSSACIVPSSEFSLLFKSDGTTSGFVGTTYGVLDEEKYQYKSESNAWDKWDFPVSDSQGEKEGIVSGKWYHLDANGKIKECLDPESHLKVE